MSSRSTIILAREVPRVREQQERPSPVARFPNNPRESSRGHQHLVDCLLPLPTQLQITRTTRETQQRICSIRSTMAERTFQHSMVDLVPMAPNPLLHPLHDVLVLDDPTQAAIRTLERTMGLYVALEPWMEVPARDEALTMDCEPWIPALENQEPA